MTAGPTPETDRGLPDDTPTRHTTMITPLSDSASPANRRDTASLADRRAAAERSTDDRSNDRGRGETNR
ncbi:hypothetical protein C463_17068 [Halorubrum californiense DSM 19288]|uniref:Uncharacterized protein n=1 Tax=Halorubrum californiense DSM 19288 TaxID=1227465 RepID=M0DV22_9EURY|nr:hypothetical protein C463_17068 [Halorubrum californiense DSM 19288]